jgi:hypothetical protein
LAILCAARTSLTASGEIPQESDVYWDKQQLEGLRQLSRPRRLVEGDADGLEAILEDVLNDSGARAERSLLRTT